MYGYVCHHCLLLTDALPCSYPSSIRPFSGELKSVFEQTGNTVFRNRFFAPFFTYEPRAACSDKNTFGV